MLSSGLHAIQERAGYVRETVAQTAYYVFFQVTKTQQEALIAQPVDIPFKTWMVVIQLYCCIL